MNIRPYAMFSTVHPMVLCVYALGAPILGMSSNVPWMLAVSLCSALAVHTFYLGGEATFSACKMVVPLMLFVAVLNVITNPRGTHILFQISMHPFTLESLCYGMASGMLLGTVIIWFRCFHAILPNDKFLYLFGRRLPGTALLLSMILKLFPETRYKVQCIRMGERPAEQSGRERVSAHLKRGMRQISALLEWSMEDSIETADSMKARAYGTAQRTSYATYHFGKSDAGMLLFFMIGIGAGITGIIYGRQSFSYYPGFALDSGYVWIVVSMLMIQLLFLLTPMWMELVWRGGR